MTCFLKPLQSLAGLALILLGFVAGPAMANPAGIEWRSAIYSFGQFAQVGRTDLVPDPSLRGYRRFSLGADIVLSPRATVGAIRFEGRFRLQKRAGHKSRLAVDEAFAEWSVTDTTFVSVGRRNLSFGQSYGINAADIFRRPLAENRVYPTAIARAMAGSVDMLSLETIFNSGSSARLILAPKDPLDASRRFAMAQVSGILGNGTLDYAIAVFGGARPGASLSMSRGVGDATVIYLDAALRRGRDRQVVSGLGAGNVLQFAPEGSNRIYPVATVGMGHTFASGMTLNLELTHDSNGLSDQEWARAMAVLAALTPVTSLSAGEALGQLNAALGQYTQRRNYGFIRLATDRLWESGFSLELTALHGFDDGSGSLGLRLEHAIGTRGTIGLTLTHGYGGRLGEFTSRPGRNTLSLYTAMSF